MPIYVYTCQSCGTEFEELVFNAAAEQKIVCSSCQSNDVKRKMSTFATTTSESSGAGPSCATGTCPFAN
ncbi:MAG: zinc ribbon domain-containing protein [candidate division Zixibacteria bacterium]|nr:zinc ribbon domain-containing protein [candidate division Zixibacteria bacterium]